VKAWAVRTPALWANAQLRASPLSALDRGFALKMSPSSLMTHPASGSTARVLTSSQLAISVGPFSSPHSVPHGAVLVL